MANVDFIKFRQKWLKIINQSSEQKCRLFLLRLKKQNIKKPFNSKQKFVYMLCKTRLEYLAQKNNPDKKVIRLPRADATDVNWTKMPITRTTSFKINKELWTKPKNRH